MQTLFMCHACISGDTCMRHACNSGATCMRHAFLSKSKNEITHFRFTYDIFEEKFAETNWIFAFLLEKYPISKKISSETEFGK
jgi:hypothetical protein